MVNHSAIVIGAGIVGIATARALAEQGYSVSVFERSERAVGASIRNFGMVWPIGQPSGALYDRARRSREIWTDISSLGDIWSDPVGSLHLAYHPDEWQVLVELYENFSKEGRNVSLLSPKKLAEKSEAAVLENLIGGLYSADELIVDPREALSVLPLWLKEKYKVDFHWKKCVSYISDQTAYVGNEEEYEADLIFICSGADLETLYPEEYVKLPLTKCKLQMMRMTAQPDDWRIGPALCGGLSLVHYKSFEAASSLPALKKRYDREMADYLDWGIHVMVSQNAAGELTVGDSHEYAHTHDPFDNELINKMILDYLKKFARFKDERIMQTWNGIYPILSNGGTDCFISPDSSVYIINAVGGAGMTLSFGLAEELVSGL